MGKHLLLLVCLSVLLSCAAGVAQAHPPSNIKLQFNPQTHVLTVTALHNVGDVTKHYIKLIEVSLNGVPIISQKFSSQTNTTVQTVQYVILDAKPGSTISVKATCNIRGSLEKSIKV
jgi:desulfoferrodoxin (superoxide reductase-like protein)